MPRAGHTLRFQSWSTHGRRGSMNRTSDFIRFFIFQTRQPGLSDLPIPDVTQNVDVNRNVMKRNFRPRWPLASFAVLNMCPFLCPRCHVLARRRWSLPTFPAGHADSPVALGHLATWHASISLVALSFIAHRTVLLNIWFSLSVYRFQNRW
jgi:hypothetical protein